MRLFGRRGAKTATSPVRVDPVILELLRSWDGSMSSLQLIYRDLAPVRTVTDFIADAVATTSLKVYRRAQNGRPEAFDHPLAQILRNPNPELTGQALIFGAVADLIVFGNAYWWKRQMGNEKWLVPVPSWRVVPRGGDVLSPSSYDFHFSGPPLNVPRDAVCHFKLYNPDDRRIGVSKLMSIKQLLAEEIEVGKHREAYWKNAARREGLLLRPEGATWSDEARDRFRADWQGRTSGSKNAGVTPVLEDGMTWQDTSFSPKDSEFIEGRRFVLEATCRVLNVPPQVLGLTGTATFASQREFSRWLYRGTLPPWYDLLTSEISLQVLTWVDPVNRSNVYPEFNVESKLRGDFLEQATIVEQAVGRPYMTVQEARNLFNLDDRGDETDDWLAVPINNVMLQNPDGMDAELAAMASPPAGTPAQQQVAKFLERQRQAVISKSVAEGRLIFDADRWNRELAALGMLSEAEIERLNGQSRAILARQLEARIGSS